MGILRLFLAVAVLLTHCPVGIIPRYMPPAHAVQCFYVVSGFLIQLVIASYAAQGSCWFMSFYKSRLLRLLPIYWLIAALTLALFGNPVLNVLWQHHDMKGLLIWGASNFTLLGEDVLRLFTYDTDLHQFTMLPPDNVFIAKALGLHTVYGGAFAIVTQSWTLAVEMLFYGIAPFLLLRSGFVVSCVFAASIAFRLQIARYGYVNNAFLYGIIFSELALFLGGALAARFYNHWLASNRLSFLLARIMPQRIAEMAVCRAGIAVLAWVLVYDTKLWHYFPRGGGWGAGLLALPYGWWAVLAMTAMSLPWLMHSFGKKRWDRFMGDLSYPVYMSHMLILRVITTYFPAIAQKQLCVCVFVLSILFSIGMVYALERPIDRLRHHWFPRGKENMTSPASMESGNAYNAL